MATIQFAVEIIVSCFFKFSSLLSSSNLGGLVFTFSPWAAKAIKSHHYLLLITKQDFAWFQDPLKKKSESDADVIELDDDEEIDDVEETPEVTKHVLKNKIEVFVEYTFHWTDNSSEKNSSQSFFTLPRLG